jgi:hypothetical protein
MIFKGRTWEIGNNKLGRPIEIRVKQDRTGEILIDEGAQFLSHHHYSEEELLDMLAILRKIKKEKREDKI